MGDDPQSDREIERTDATGERKARRRRKRKAPPTLETEVDMGPQVPVFLFALRVQDLDERDDGLLADVAVFNKVADIPLQLSLLF